MLKIKIKPCLNGEKKSNNLSHRFLFDDFEYSMSVMKSFTSINKKEVLYHTACSKLIV
jgi:hypothetical protein